MTDEKREAALVRWSESPAFIPGGRFDCFRAGYDACAADNAERVRGLERDYATSLALEQGLHERAIAAESALAEARATIEAQAHSLSVATEAIDRLRTVIDECFGMQPVMSADEALTFLEQRLFADRQTREADRATIERVRKLASSAAISIPCSNSIIEALEPVKP